MKSEKLVIATKIFCNHCERCETCQPQIITALENVDGVKSVELDVPKQEITVWYNPKKIAPDGIRHAIVMAGYAADDLAPDPAAYERLDGCCKEGNDGSDH
ncbi:MAG: hypothetical protein RL220_643 [Bacteroidota bacterium]